MAGTGTAYPADAVTGSPVYAATQGRTVLSAAMAGATATRPLGGFTGVRPGTSTTSATATSTTYTVTPFAGYIDLESPGTTGGYFFSFQSNVTGSVTAAAASARVDLLYVQINDSNTGDGSSGAPRVSLDYQAGTPGAGVPALSAARAFVIAQINVPTAGSPTVTWVAPYCVAAGGILPVPTYALLPGSGTPVGQRAEVLADSTAANNGLYRYDGTTWRPQTSSAPVIAGSVAGTTVTANNVGRVSFTGASVVNVNNCWSSGSDRFDVYIDITGMSTPGQIQFVFRSGGTDITTANYDYELSFQTGSTSSNPATGAAQNAWQVTAGATGSHFIHLLLVNPNVATLKRVILKSTDYTGAAAPVTVSGSGGFRLSTPYDGFSILVPGGGTIAGSITVEAHLN